MLGDTRFLTLLDNAAQMLPANEEALPEEALWMYLKQETHGITPINVGAILEDPNPNSHPVMQYRGSEARRHLNALLSVRSSITYNYSICSGSNG
jgi:hypothetical protein